MKFYSTMQKIIESKENRREYELKMSNYKSEGEKGIKEKQKVLFNLIKNFETKKLYYRNL